MENLIEKITRATEEGKLVWQESTLLSYKARLGKFDLLYVEYPTVSKSIICVCHNYNEAAKKYYGVFARINNLDIEDA